MTSKLCFLLLSIYLPGLSGGSLESIPSSPVLKKPGETLSISCKGSGYTFGEHAVHWVRQPTAKGLEWIGRVRTDTGEATYASRFSGNLQITKDNAKSMSFLKLSGLKAEDSAVYYCARGIWGGGNDHAFDYWGKGTMVTISSDTAKAPTSLLTLMNCGTPTNDKYSIGCLATGFTPPSVTFKWTNAAGTALSDVVQYPAVQTNGAYASVSQLRLDKNDWENAKSLTCAVEHPAGNKEEVVKIPVTTSPTVVLLSASRESTQFLMCLIKDFQPKTITVTWKKNGTKVEGPTSIVGQQKPSGLFGASSVLNVSKTDWESKATYRCDVEHKGKLISQEIFKSESMTVTLNPPNVYKVFTGNQAELECVAISSDTTAVREATIIWKVNKQSKSGSITEQLNDRPIPRKVSTLTLSREEWVTVNTVQCSAERNGITTATKELTINHGCKDFSVSVHVPTEMPINDQDDVTLICLVVSQSLCDFHVLWKQSDKKNHEGITSPPQKTPSGRYSVTSVYTTSKKDWDNNVLFSCAVVHDGMETGTSPREYNGSKASEKNLLPMPSGDLVTDCNKMDNLEDELRSLWSTTSTFIILFFLSITYSAVISLVKKKQ